MKRAFLILYKEEIFSMKRFSQMTTEELHAEIKHLSEELEQAQKMGNESQVAILKQKRNLARSYLKDPQLIPTEQWVELEGSNQRFYVKYLNGIMAWGYYENNETVETAVPIACIQT